MITRLTILMVVLVMPCIVSAQTKTSLTGESYDYLDEKIEDLKNSKSVLPYLEAYLEKAKREDNPEELINAYHNYIYEVDEHQKITYNDSMLYAAERTDSNELIGSAVLTRGIIYYSRKEYNRALDCYLYANRLIATGKNEYLKKKVQYNIAHIKYYLGYYNDAITLFKNCAEFFKKEDSHGYLSCLHSLAPSYTKSGSFAESTEVSELAVLESTRLKNYSMLTYINHAQGINEYFRKDYASAEYKLKTSLPYLMGKNDFGNLSVAYFYLACIKWEAGRKADALPYLLNVDRIFVDKKYIRPDLRQNYEMLIDYYAARGDRDKELLYINRLLQADKILHANFRYLTGKVFKEYDTAELQKAKGNIEKQLKREQFTKSLLLLLAALLLPLSAYLVYRNYRLGQYKKSFDNYKERSTFPVHMGSAKHQRPNIPEDLEKNLLEKLEQFETTKGFAKKDVKTEKLAASFGTNSKYLSQVVNYHKGKSYPEYINDLRIAYIVKRIEEDTKLRQYTFTAIAEEAGFGTAQQFTDVFKKKMGMPLTFFLRQLNDSNK